MTIASSHPALVTAEHDVLQALRGLHGRVSGDLARLAREANSTRPDDLLGEAAVVLALTDPEAELACVNGEEALEFFSELEPLEAPELLANTLCELARTGSPQAREIGTRVIGHLLDHAPQIAFFAVTVTATAECMTDKLREDIAVRALKNIDEAGSVDCLARGLEDTDWVFEHLEHHSDLGPGVVRNIARRAEIPLPQSFNRGFETAAETAGPGLA